MGSVVESRIADHLPVIPKYHASGAGRFVMVRTPTRAFGVDRKTGKRVWNWPWFSNTKSKQPDDDVDENYRIEQRVFEDSSYGRFSTDGASVFMLGGLEYRRRLSDKFLFSREEQRSELAALDIQSEGRLLWCLGGDRLKENTEREFAGAFFMGAPVVSGGDLFVIAVVQQKLQLVTLDPTSGKLRWSVDLRKIDAAEKRSNVVRRFAGARPTVVDGIVVCPIVPGEVAGIDIATKKIAWKREFRDDSPVLSRPTLSRMSLQIDKSDQRWIDAQLIRAGKLMLVTAYETTELLAIDHRSGQLKWKHPREQAMYVAAAGDTVLLVSPTDVRCIRLADGSRRWRLPIESVPSGHGFYRAGHCHLPTLSGDVLRIRVDDGVVDARSSMINR